MGKSSNSRHIKLGQNSRTMARIDAIEEIGMESVDAYKPKRYSEVSLDNMFTSERKEEKKRINLKKYYLKIGIALVCILAVGVLVSSILV